MNPRRLLRLRILVSFRVLLPTLLAALFAAPYSFASWSSDPAENLELFSGSGDNLPRAAVADGNGGMWVVWDSNDDNAKGPHLQHVDAKGDLLLGPSGLRLVEYISGNIDLLFADDGGVFVAWADYRSASSWDIYAQRVSAAGLPQWETDGRLVAKGPDVAVAVGGLGLIARSTDDGDTWISITNPSMVSIRGVAVTEDRVLAVGDNETFLMSSDQGLTWSVLQTGIGPSINAVDAFIAFRGVAVGDGGRSWTWSGSSWTLHTHAVTIDFHGISMPDYEIATAVGKNGRIARTSDRGASWVEQTSGVGLHLNAVSFSSVDTGTVVGNLGIVLRTVDGGANWTIQTSGISHNLLAVDFFDDQNGVAVGENDAVIFTRDGGGTWSEGSTPTALRLSGVDMIDADMAVAVGDNGTILQTTDGGATWTQQPAPGGGLDYLAVSAAHNRTLQLEPQLVRDGTGGVIVLWRGHESGDLDVFAQRLDATGDPVWASPVQVSESVDDVHYYKTAPRDGGGAIAVWVESLGATNEIHAQAIEADGNLLGPQPVNTYASFKIELEASPDGKGGCLVTWTEIRNVYLEIFATRLDPDANPMWITDGQLVAGQSSSSQANPTAAPDGTGGGFFVWRQSEGGVYTLVGQRLDGQGNQRWTPDLQITAFGNQFSPHAVPDGYGNILLTWEDTNNGGEDLVGQVVYADGDLRWPGGATIHSGGEEVYSNPDIRPVVPDGTGGLMTVWAESRAGIEQQTDVYAQNVDRHGYLGLPAPTIESVVDVPYDEGGFVTVSWTASYLDAVPHEVITQYSTWRSNPGLSKAARMAVALESQAAAVRAGLDPDLVAKQVATGWVFLGTTPAAYLPQYGFDAATYGDQTPTETPITDFQVMAHGANPFMSWKSEPASGTSIDNLAPIAPASLLATEAGGQVDLVWNDGPGGVEDLGHYRIYRGYDPGFLVDASNLLTTSFERNVVDPFPGGSTVFYRVTAVDVHTNESEPSNVAGVGVVTGVEPDLESRFLLRPAHPNPTSGASVLSFAVPTPGRARVEIYDLAGRRVFHEELGSIGAGWHRWDFRGVDRRGIALASGIYLVRLSHAGQTQAAKIVLSR